jgi:hypothetical protein
MLAPNHRAELARSTLTDHTIATSGLYSASAAELGPVLGYPVPCGGLVFPYHFPPPMNGDTPYARVKLDLPDLDGKRYRAPKAPNRLYIPPDLPANWVTDVRIKLYITEGEKKALAGAQAGLPCIAIAGVWNWKTRDADDESQSIADLDAIAWKHRSVVLTFDADGSVNKSVRLAEFKFAEDLRGRGAIVTAIRLPGPEKGLDDFLMTHSIETFCELPDVTTLNPALDPGVSVVERIGNGYRVRFPLHDVTVTVTNLREERVDVHAEILITHPKMDEHWSRLNLAAARSRAEIVKGLKVRDIPWAPILERSCRLVVEAARAGNPVVRIVPRLQRGERHVIAPVAPIGVTTVLYGPGGSAKGYLAVALALAISSGATLPIPIRTAVQGPVLYLDWESTEADLAERALHLANGLGCEVRDLHYKNMQSPLATELPAVQTAVHEVKAVAVIVDSLVPASGHEPETAGAAQRVFEALRTLDPVSRLVIAHVSKATLTSGDPGKPFGSIFIENLARSTWEIRGQEEDDGADLVQTLFHRKVNTGRKHRPFAFRFHWDADPAEVVSLTSAEVEPAETAQGTELRHRLMAALRAKSPQTPMELAQLTGATAVTVRATLNNFVRDFVRVGEHKPGVSGLWALQIKPF